MDNLYTFAVNIGIQHIVLMNKKVGSIDRKCVICQ